MTTEAQRVLKNEVRSIAEHMQELDNHNNKVEFYEEFARLYMLACWGKRIVQGNLCEAGKSFDYFGDDE